MKWKHLILPFAVFAALFSCTRTNAPLPEEDMLYRVECFYQQNPDSALQILDTLNVSVLSEKEQAHYCLLEALLIGNTKRYDAEFDSLLHVAEDNFIGSNNKYHEALTLWLVANKTTNTQQPSQLALDALLKARKSIENCRHVDHRLVEFSKKPTDGQAVIEKLKYDIILELGMTYAGSVYSAEAIPLLTLADAYFAKTGDHYNRESSAYMLGFAYLSVNEFDSCLAYFQKGLCSAEALGYANDCAFFRHNLACYYNSCVDQNHYENDDERQQLLDNAIMEAKNGMASLTDTSDYSYGYFRQLMLETLSSTYFLMQQYDSCIYYGEQAVWTAEANDRNFESYDLYMKLYESYNALGDEKNAVAYSERLLTMEHPEAHMKDMVEVQKEYDKQEELMQQENENQQKRLRLYILLLLLFIALLTLFFFYYRYRKNKELEMLRIHSEQQKLQNEQQQLQSDIESKKQQSHAMLIAHARKIYYKGGDGSVGKVFDSIMTEFNAQYPNAQKKLKAAFPDFTDSEIDILILWSLSFQIKDMALILGLSENTVAKYRSNIRQKTKTADIYGLIKPILD